MATQELMNDYWAQYVPFHPKSLVWAMDPGTAHLVTASAEIQAWHLDSETPDPETLEFDEIPDVAPLSDDEWAELEAERQQEESDNIRLYAQLKNLPKAQPPYTVVLVISGKTELVEGARQDVLKTVRRKLRKAGFTITNTTEVEQILPEKSSTGYHIIVAEKKAVA